MLEKNWIASSLCLKKAVPKFLSVKSIVIAPAKTGKDNNNKKAVTRIDQENKGILCKVIPGALMFKYSSYKIYCAQN